MKDKKYVLVKADLKGLAFFRRSAVKGTQVSQFWYFYRRLYLFISETKMATEIVKESTEPDLKADTKPTGSPRCPNFRYFFFFKDSRKIEIEADRRRNCQECKVGSSWAWSSCETYI